MVSDMFFEIIVYRLTKAADAYFAQQLLPAVTKLLIYNNINKCAITWNIRPGGVYLICTSCVQYYTNVLYDKAIDSLNCSPQALSYHERYTHQQSNDFIAVLN